MNTEVIASFICCGEYMVVVKLEHGTHVMPHEEWKNGKRIRKHRKLA